MATIKEKENGKFLIGVSLGKDENGKRLREYCIYEPEAKTPAKRRKEVEAYAVEWEEKIKLANCFDGHKLTFADYYTYKWLPWAKSKDSKLTIRAREDYVVCIEKRVLPYIGSMKMDAIKSGNIRDILTAMSSENLSAGRERKVLTAISSVFRLAIIDTVVEYNPCISAREAVARQEGIAVEKHFSVDEAIAFLAFLDEPYSIIHKPSKQTRNGVVTEIAGYKETRSVSLMWRCYFNMALYSGARRGEMLGLSWNDVDFEAGSISITKATSDTKEQGNILKGTKSKAGERVVSLPAKVMNLLREWRLEEMQMTLTLGTAWQGTRGSDFDKNRIFITAFGAPMSSDAPYQCFKGIISRYNADEKHTNKLPDIPLHGLRHSCASLLVMQGVDVASVAKRLGHSRSTTTLTYYTQADRKADMVTCNALEKCLG